jgi:hypothetical protein
MKCIEIKSQMKKSAMHKSNSDKTPVLALIKFHAANPEA